MVIPSPSNFMLFHLKLYPAQVFLGSLTPNGGVKEAINIHVISVRTLEAVPVFRPHDIVSGDLQRVFPGDRGMKLSDGSAVKVPDSAIRAIQGQ